MVVDVILLQDTSPIVIEVDANLLATVNAVPSECGLTACRDPHTSQCIRVDLIAFNNATPIIMLEWNESAGRKI